LDPTTPEDRVMPTPLVCLSHVAWSSGADHPGHLMTRLARHRGVVVLERSAAHARLPLLGAARSGDVTVLTPYLPAGIQREDEPRVLAPLLEALLENEGVIQPILWVCDAHSLPVAARLRPTAIVYDCPWGLEYELDRSRAAAESALLRVADLVVVHDSRDATRLRDRHPLVHRVPDDAGARPSPAGTDTAARLLEDLLKTLVALRPQGVPAPVPLRATRPRGVMRSSFLP
jgi:hypothetical protein